MTARVCVDTVVHVCCLYVCVQCAAIRCGCVVVAHLHDTVHVTVVMCSHGTCMPGMVCVCFVSVHATHRHVFGYVCLLQFAVCVT